MVYINQIVIIGNKYGEKNWANFSVKNTTLANSTAQSSTSWMNITSQTPEDLPRPRVRIIPLFADEVDEVSNATTLCRPFVTQDNSECPRLRSIDDFNSKCQTSLNVWSSSFYGNSSWETLGYDLGMTILDATITDTDTVYSTSSYTLDDGYPRMRMFSLSTTIKVYTADMINNNPFYPDCANSMQPLVICGKCYIAAASVQMNYWPTTIEKSGLNRTVTPRGSEPVTAVVEGSLSLRHQSIYLFHKLLHMIVTKTNLGRLTKS